MKSVASFLSSILGPEFFSRLTGHNNGQLPVVSGTALQYRRVISEQKGRGRAALLSREDRRPQDRWTPAGSHCTATNSASARMSPDALEGRWEFSRAGQFPFAP